MKYKKFIVDTTISVAFWSALWTIIDVAFLRLDYTQTVNLLVSGAIMNAVMGGPFGRILDVSRRVFNVDG